MIKLVLFLLLSVSSIPLHAQVIKTSGYSGPGIDEFPAEFALDQDVAKAANELFLGCLGDKFLAQRFLTAVDFYEFILTQENIAHINATFKTPLAPVIECPMEPESTQALKCLAKMKFGDTLKSLVEQPGFDDYFRLTYEMHPAEIEGMKRKFASLAKKYPSPAPSKKYDPLPTPMFPLIQPKTKNGI